MEPDPEDLRRHYASLSDEALGDIDPSELVDVARECYDEEIARRGLASPEAPDWLEQGATACTFYAAAEAGDAREVLERHDIPCFIETRPLDSNRTEYQVMVPSRLTLKALSVLDKEVFNPEMEAEWKSHFEELSEEEFGELDLESMISGMEDRIERLKRVYAQELERRGLSEIKE